MTDKLTEIPVTTTKINDEKVSVLKLDQYSGGSQRLPKAIIVLFGQKNFVVFITIFGK